MKKMISKIASFLLAAVMVLAMPIMAFADGEDIPEVDTMGVYHARLGIQAQTPKDASGSQTWVWRIGYYHAPDGDVVHTGDDDTTSEKYQAYDSTFTDAEIKGNGTYTVTLESKDLGGAVDISQLHVATDIPKYEDSPIEFSNLKVSINDRQVFAYSDVYVDEDKYAGDECVLLAYNNWRDDLKNGDCMEWENVIPTDGDIKISLTFTVSGFDYDNEDQQTTEAPTEASTQAPKADATTASSDSADSTFPTWAIVVIVAVVVVVVVVVIVSVSKKKKK